MMEAEKRYREFMEMGYDHSEAVIEALDSVDLLETARDLNVISDKDMDRMHDACFAVASEIWTYEVKK